MWTGKADKSLKLLEIMGFSERNGAPDRIRTVTFGIGIQHSIQLSYGCIRRRF